MVEDKTNVDIQDEDMINDFHFEGEETLSMNSFNNEDIDDVYPDAILNISRETASVFQLKRRWEKEPSQLDLTPPFQRELVWGLYQKCELIESIIMGIPIPVFYVRENAEGVYIVVDGKQRLTTLFDFINGKFALDKLSILKDYRGRRFSDLSPLDQNKIEDCSLSLNVIKAPTSDRVMFDLFDRVNRGGTRLNNQEMRNALYQGNSTRLIDELAKNPEFKAATEDSISSKHMKDRYLVLRFLAFYMWQEKVTRDVETDDVLDYKSNIEDFLGKTMAFLNALSDQDVLLTTLRNVFIDSMRRAKELILPLGGFRLPSLEGKSKRPINMAFFESLGFLLAKCNNISVEQASAIYDELLSDEAYVRSITHSVDSRKQIYVRYDIIKNIIRAVKDVK